MKWIGRLPMLWNFLCEDRHFLHSTIHSLRCLEGCQYDQLQEEGFVTRNPLTDCECTYHKHEKGEDGDCFATTRRRKSLKTNRFYPQVGMKVL